MKLSIITICYNIKNEIERTCKSIVSQTNQDFEWIVVDGGSTDGTVDILNKYKDKMTIFISEPDKGIYNAMNKGIKLAKGEYLNFMNGGDCFASNDVVENFYQSSAYGADIVYGNINIIKEKGRVKIKTYPKQVDKKFFIRRCINHQASFIKRELFDKYGLYNESYKIVSDWEKWIVFSENNCNFKYWNNLVANFGAGGISAQKTPKLIKERENVLNAHYNPKEIERFGNYLQKKSNVCLFNIFPVLTIKSNSDDSKKVYKLFDFVPLYKINKNPNKSQHYLFGFIPFLKIKEK